METKLFSRLKLRELEFKNRIFVSPMCQYSCEDGLATDWHLVHLGSRAVGGAALVITEAAAVSPEGRISPYDLGIWSDKHVQPLKRITSFIKEQGAVPGIQIAHAGRKASTDAPWNGGKPIEHGAKAWQPIGPSPIPFSYSYQIPLEMTQPNIDEVLSMFSSAVRRSIEAGFEVVEIHMAHGYLLHEFLSPLSNHRTDTYGGSLENRMRMPLQVAQLVRKLWPDNLPVFVRVSSTDWVDGGWDIAQAIKFAHKLKEYGIDLIDCSSGGLVPYAVVPEGPGYQTPFAAAIRKEAGIPTGAVGMITEPFQAEQIIATGIADALVLGREVLRNPYWPLHAARSLKADASWPKQYLRAKI
ncbi:MAG: NADH:flavin oxidoreductase/NADH oxidase [Deltaproteobacteria bacterium]|nr:NADH:flavin oxidoreductase/NADH oxidase [Deltaproteobacteria bacterium]MCL5791999.1 NADH:flavin oxidoreductase/NADH oxidase [Deltaproteobacteria bacterium]